jgi:aspartyl-tRNA(Asn)/glutamyl-tRNA(Gln) amidotransferase subunit C
MSEHEKGPISREEILHLGKLASLPIAEEEIATLGNDLGVIVGHVQKVLGAAGAPVASAPHADGTLQLLRPDAVRPGLTREEALAAAPETSEGGFSVPTFVKE